MINYIEENNCFAIKIEETEYRISVPINVVPEYDETDYEYFFLQNVRQDAAESSIYKVWFDEVRIGWVFPIQALVSDLHRYAEDDHFLKYAYVAYRVLIKEMIEKGDFPEDEIVSIDKVFNSEMNILLIDKNNASEIPNYNYNHYRIGLLVKGYLDEQTIVKDYCDLERERIEVNLKIKRVGQ